MTTAARPITCGFCARAACDRCPGTLDAHGHQCACQHTPEPTVRAVEAGPALTLISSTGPAPRDIDLRLDSALSALHTALTDLDEALLGYIELHTTDPVPLVITTSALDEQRKTLARLAGSVEAAACRQLRGGPITLPDGRVAERLGGRKRTQWQHDRIAHRVAEHAALTAATVADPDSGEVVLDEALAAAVHAGAQALMAVSRPSWRTTDLRKTGIRYDDAVTEEPGIASLKVSAPASEQ